MDISNAHYCDKYFLKTLKWYLFICALRLCFNIAGGNLISNAAMCDVLLPKPSYFPRVFVAGLSSQCLAEYYKYVRELAPVERGDVDHVTLGWSEL